MVLLPINYSNSFFFQRLTDTKPAAINRMPAADLPPCTRIPAAQLGSAVINLSVCLPRRQLGSAATERFIFTLTGLFSLTGERLIPVGSQLKLSDLEGVEANTRKCQSGFIS